MNESASGSSLNGGTGNNPDSGKEPKLNGGDAGTDVPDTLLMSPNNGMHQHQHHHHHHHNHGQHQQPPPVNGGNGGFYEQKNDQQEEDDGLGPLPPKWEKAYTDSGEVYFIEQSPEVRQRRTNTRVDYGGALRKQLVKAQNTRLSHTARRRCSALKK